MLIKDNKRKAYLRNTATRCCLYYLNRSIWKIKSLTKIASIQWDVCQTNILISLSHLRLMMTAYFDDKYDFQFENVAHEIARILKIGGVCVWIVGDATKMAFTGTSFRQALFFYGCLWPKITRYNDLEIRWVFSAVGSLRSRYAPVFEYMFVFSKGKTQCDL